MWCAWPDHDDAVWEYCVLWWVVVCGCVFVFGCVCRDLVVCHCGLHPSYWDVCLWLCMGLLSYLGGCAFCLLYVYVLSVL